MFQFRCTVVSLPRQYLTLQFEARRGLGEPPGYTRSSPT